MQMQLLKRKLISTNLPFDSESFIIAGVIWRNKTCVVLTVLDNFFPNLSISCTVWLPKKKGLTDRGNSWSAIFLSFSVCLPAFLPLLPFWLYALLKEKYDQYFFGVWWTFSYFPQMWCSENCPTLWNRHFGCPLAGSFYTCYDDVEIKNMVWVSITLRCSSYP